jgi:hypothetical protein
MVVSMKKKGPYTLPMLRAQNTFTFGLPLTCTRKTRGFFAALDPAVVGIELATDMKRALVTENYGVRKSLIVFYLMKHLHTEFVTNYRICIRNV